MRAGEKRELSRSDAAQPRPFSPLPKRGEGSETFAARIVEAHVNSPEASADGYGDGNGENEPPKSRPFPRDPNNRQTFARAEADERNLMNSLVSRVIGVSTLFDPAGVALACR